METNTMPFSDDDEQDEYDTENHYQLFKNLLYKHYLSNLSKHFVR